jgi:hypothetical protein
MNAKTMAARAMRGIFITFTRTELPQPKDAPMQICPYHVKRMSFRTGRYQHPKVVTVTTKVAKKLSLEQFCQAVAESCRTSNFARQPRKVVTVTTKVAKKLSHEQLCQAVAESCHSDNKSREKVVTRATLSGQPRKVVTVTTKVVKKLSHEQLCQAAEESCHSDNKSREKVVTRATLSGSRGKLSQ